MNSDLAGTIEIDDLEAGFDKLKENFENGTSLNATSLGSSLGVTIATELKNKIDEMIDKTLEETEETNNGTTGTSDTEDYDEGTFYEKQNIFVFFYRVHFLQNIF